MKNTKELEDFFIANNGFTIKKDFGATKLDFISRISPHTQYHFDMFEYDNLFYVIPIDKEIIKRCEFLDNIINQYPSFGSSVVTATSDIIVAGFFDVTYFVNAVINMMTMLKIKYGLIKEKDSYFQDYIIGEEAKITGLCPFDDIPIHSFLNTHHAIFSYFRFYSIERDYTLNMLGLVFDEIFPKNPNTAVFDNYFGFHNGNETARDMSKFRSIQFEYDPIDLDTIGSIINTNEYDVNEFVSGSGNKLINMPKIPTRDYTYLKLMFWKLTFNRSKHVLVKTENSDDRLSKYKRYLNIDDNLFMQYDNQYTPNGTNLQVVGFKNIDIDFNDRMEHIVFDKSLEKIREGYCTGFRKLKSITFLGDIDTIPADFCNLSSIEQVNLKRVKKIGSRFLAGCKNIKNLDINNVEEIENDFIAISDIERLIINTSSLRSIGNSFAFYSKIINIDLSCDFVKSIGESFMSHCRKLKIARFRFPLLTAINNNFLSECVLLTEFELIASEAQSIGDMFLYNAKSLVKFNMPYWPKIIEDDFLGNAKSITSIPHVDKTSNIETIGKRFLKGAISLTTFTISSQPRSVGEDFMSDCTSLISKKIFI